jgi:hypothetical protein
VKLDQALTIAGKARIRRRIAASNDAAEQVASSSDRPVALRDPHGRFLKGWAGGPGRPPRDLLREAYIDDLFAVWKRHGRHAIRQLCQEDPRSYLRLIANLVGSKRRKGK